MIRPIQLKADESLDMDSLANQVMSKLQKRVRLTGEQYERSSGVKHLKHSWIFDQGSLNCRNPGIHRYATSHDEQSEKARRDEVFALKAPSGIP